jgi:asparagine synthetase B (glutamine-hydrolysing)
MSARELRSYSVVFPHLPEVDESRRIGELRSSLQIDGVESRFEPGSPISFAARFVSEWKVPPLIPNGFIWEPLLTRARSDGVEVMLDGNGGDELFGCSPFLLADLLRSGRLFKLLHTARRLPGMGHEPPRRRLWRGVKQYGIRGSIPPGLHSAARSWRLQKRTEWPWLATGTVEMVRESSRYDWKRIEGPRWWAALVNFLVLVPDALDGVNELRRQAAMSGIQFAHPWRDQQLIEHMLQLDPQLSFDPVHDRPVARAAMRGLLPDPIRLSEEKPVFNAVLEEALGGQDLQVVNELLSDPPEPLIEHLRRENLPELLRRRTGRPQALDVWRLATAALWLRNEGA